MKSVQTLLAEAERHVARLHAAARSESSEQGARVIEREAERWDALIREARREVAHAETVAERMLEKLWLLPRNV